MYAGTYPFADASVATVKNTHYVSLLFVAMCSLHVFCMFCVDGCLVWTMFCTSGEHYGGQW